MKSQNKCHDKAERTGRMILFLAVLFSAAMLWQGTGASAAEGGEQPKAGTVNVAVYILGGDLERDSGAASADLNEIMRARWQGGTAVFIATGGAEHWTFSGELDSRACFSRLLEEKITVERSLQDRISDGETLRAFLVWCAEQRAADVTVLILWGHGMKDPAGIGTDLTAEKQTLTLAEIASAVERSRVQVDVIGMDACSMAGAETVRAMKGSCGYLVVSEDEEALEGWPYHHLAEIMTGNAEQIAMNIADCVNTDRIRKGKPAGLTVIRMNGEEREP